MLLANERALIASAINTSAGKRTQSQLVMSYSATPDFYFRLPVLLTFNLMIITGATSPFCDPTLQLQPCEDIKLALRIAEASIISYFPIIMSSGASVSSSHLSSKVSVQLMESPRAGRKKKDVTN